MDTLSEEFKRIDGDPQMTMLTQEGIYEEGLGISDEVEDLRKSLREAVHDEAVRPKMQCLMMDPSFSMVTVQGEDSGIEWETTSSRSTTPWASEGGNSTLEFSAPVSTRPVTPGSVPAGRIIFVMDEEQIRKRKKSKGSGRKSRAEKPKEHPVEDFDGASGRPELVEVSLPNVKVEGEGKEEEAADPSEDKEQRLFRLVSEGSEILNIVVPPKLVTVDEEESTVMVDNLSYLEDTLVIKLTEEEDNDDVFEPSDEAAISTQAPAGSGRGTQGEGSHLFSRNLMDPPGAPVARPLTGGAGREDYFEKFTLIDAQAPGGPAVVKEGQEEEQTEEDGEIQESAEPEQPKGKSTPVTVPVDEGTTEDISEEEIASDLLDEVFYGGMDDKHLKEPQDREEECMVPRSPLKKSGSALFGSQEDILTPIFLPEGPPKLIDLILLEEPKAMAFLYTDLYEEAMGSRQKDEDAESMTSEKSFHSRHSDREDRGYLEKYVLKDETPVVAGEAEPAEEQNHRQEGGVRMLSQDSYSDFLPSAEQDDLPATGEEITDFFRSSANASPCDMEPFPPLQEKEDVAQPKEKRKAKEKKLAPKTAVPQAQVQQPSKATEKEGVPKTTDPLSVSSHKPSSVLSGGEIEKDLSEDLQTQPSPLSKNTNEGMPKPVAPPRRKAASAPKTSLDLTPLTPVEGEECGGKEQREEEKEKASPAETADEWEGDGDETGRASSIVAPTEDASASITELTESSETKASLELTPLVPVEAVEGGEECGGKEQREEEKEKASPAETADEGDGDETGQASSIFALTKDVPALITELTKAAETDIVPGEDTNTETLKEEKCETETAAGETGPQMADKQSGRCIIL